MARGRRLLLVLIALVMAAPSLAADKATKDDAKAMAEHAVGYFQKFGRDDAFTAFDTGTKGFKDRDLYVFVYTKNGVCVSHGANPAMVGKNLLELKDTDGTEMIRAIVGVKDKGWVTYQWGNPLSHDVQTKTAYIIQFDAYWFGVGAYIP
jgi:cytochrome c